MTNSIEVIVSNAIANHRKTSDRIAALEARAFEVVEKAMGSGGVGQLKNGYIQISYGRGKWNYAKVVKLNK